MVNLNDFDTKLFLDDTDPIAMVRGLSELSDFLESTMRHRITMELTTTDGSGAFRVIEDFRLRYKTQIQVEDCRGRRFVDVIANVMRGFHFGTRTLNMNSALPFHMIQGLLYFLDQKNFRTLLVFKNFYCFRLEQMLEAISCLSRLNRKAGIVIHTTEDASFKLCNHKNSSVRIFFRPLLVTASRI